MGLLEYVHSLLIGGFLTAEGALKSMTKYTGG